MKTLQHHPDLFHWADLQARLRHPLPAIARRIARRASITELHALAFVQANGIGPTGGT
jgi:hypothetical protein